MSLDAEQRIQRRNTAAFIAAAPLLLALTPNATVPTDAGGTRWVAGSPREVQRLRLIDQSSSFASVGGTFYTSDGQQRLANFQLLGEWDATIELYDYWITDGIRYEVVNVLPYNGYERRGRVVRHGN